MTQTDFDFVLIGQGLAGTALAWELLHRGVRVLVIDRQEPHTSSRIAAGLVTPITGMRLVKSTRFDALWETARDFYRRVEDETGVECLHESPMVRLFANPQEQTIFEAKSAGEFAGIVRRPAPPVDAAFIQPLGGMEMLSAARLDVTAYLDASRAAFTQRGAFAATDIDLARDLELNNVSVRVRSLGVTAGTLVFCQGIAAVDNPWFGGLQFDAAKGEILTLRIPGLNESRVVHRGVWLAPAGNDLFRAGATYDREHWDNIPTSEGRTEICRRLQQFLSLPFEVIEHRAAVRPILDDKRPVLGRHPNLPQLAYFNGLASKGTLQAPFFAGQLADHLLTGVPLEPEVDVRQRKEFAECSS